MRITTTVRNSLVDEFAGQVDAGTGTSVIQLRTGSPPASINDAAAGTLLAEVDLPDPTFGAAAGGAVEANSITPVEAVASGDIGHFRVLNGDGTVVEDSGSVGTTGTELVVNTVSVETGDTVEITSWTVDMPEE